MRAKVQVASAFLLVLLIVSARVIAGQRAVPSELRRAAELIELGKYEEAAAQVREVLKADPNSALASRLLGIVYQRQEKFPQAEEVLEKAARLGGSQDPQTLFVLAQVKFGLKKTSEALDLANQAAALAGNDAGAHYSIGRLLREHTFLEQGLKELERARQLAPQDPAIITESVIAGLESGRSNEAEALLQPLLANASYQDLLQAGSRFGETGQFGSAIRAFERAVELRPEAYDARYNLALAYFRQQDFAKTLATLHRIPPASANHQADYHYLRGKAHLGLGEVQAAGEELLGALKRQPDNESLCADAGLLFFRHESFWKALEVFETCARRLSDSVALQTGLGLTYFRLGKYDDAANVFRKVLTLEPGADAAREALAFLFYISGNLDEARALLEQRLGAPETDYYAYYLHALVLVRQQGAAGRVAALRSLDEALRRNTRFAPAYFQRGKAWSEEGAFERALADLGRATELDPSYAQPYYLIAQINYKLGRKRDAEQARLRFMALDREKEEREQNQQVVNRLLQSLQ